MLFHRNLHASPNEVWQGRARSLSFNQHVLHRHPDHVVSSAPAPSDLVCISSWFALCVCLTKSQSFPEFFNRGITFSCGTRVIIEAKPVVCSSFSFFTILAMSRKDRDLRVCSLDSGCERWFSHLASDASTRSKVFWISAVSEHRRVHRELRNPPWLLVNPSTAGLHVAVTVAATTLSVWMMLRRDQTLRPSGSSPELSSGQLGVRFHCSSHVVG